MRNRPHRALGSALLAAACVSFAVRAEDVPPAPDAAARLDEAALADAEAYERLCHLCDRIGNRLSGSPALDRAVEWAAETMRRDGLANVRTQPVKVPHWVRGEERAELVAPARHAMTILGLGGSIGTPQDGIEADVVAVKNFEALAKLGDSVRGKIVLYNAVFTTYGETVAYRVKGAVEAAKLGAVAVFVRSVTPWSLCTPHTGMLSYDEKVPPIPAAAVTLEDADRIQRLQDRGAPVRARLSMGARTLPDADSANVIGEVPGRTDEIVLLGAHLDSWDVGAGAHDDGGGCITVMEVARLMVKLGLKPRRTIRIVLFVNEENGLRGAKAYRDGHEAEIPRHVAAIETDVGVDAPIGFGISVSDKAKHERALAALQAIGRELEPLGAGRIEAEGGGADLGPLEKDGVPVMGLNTDMATYWHYHHTWADTPDKVDPEKLKKHIAVLAWMAWRLADRDRRLGD